MADAPNLDQTTALPQTGTGVFARYRLKAEIGRGGMGVVWRAEDTKLQRDVALKFLPELVVRNREAMADLAAETRRCLALTHPHIVRVYDLVEEGSRAAISMEFIDGPSLAERKLQQPDRCFTVDALRSWLAQLCAALDYAHSKVRVVHRDLKPLNLLVNSDGDLKVVDFGIARSLLAGNTRALADTTGASVSLGYAGPQQVMGEPAAVSDDIYSLGATLYELLTSKPPFYEGDIIAQLREMVPPPMAARRAALGLRRADPIPPEWEKTVAACLAKRAEDRPRSAGEVAARLGLPMAGDATAKLTPARRTARRPLLTGGLAVLVLAGAASVMWQRSGSEQPMPAAPVTDGTIPAEPMAPRGPQFVLNITPPNAGARVWLGPEHDRAVPDTGQLSLPVPAGGHELVVQASGYHTHRDRVTMTSTGGSVAITLKPVFAPVVFAGRPGTVVTAIDARGREIKVGTIPATGPLRVDQALTIGRYRFRYSHPDSADYEVAETTLTAGPRPNRITAVQISRPAELQVFSVPDGADVLIDGTKVGTTPGTFAAPSQKMVTVEVALRGYRRDKRTFTLKPGETRTIDSGSMVAESGAISLRLGDQEFRMPRATVRVDGTPMQAKDGQLKGLEIGNHELEVLHPDYQPWKQTVDVRDRLVTPIAVKLVPKDGELAFAVTGPSAYTVTVNGKPATLRNGAAGIPSGENVAIEISARGYKTERRQVKLAPRAKQTLTIAMEKIAYPELRAPWTIPDLGLTLLPVAAGTFVMGSTERSGEPHERPQTQVTLTKPYWLGRTEVTQREWSAVMGSNPSRFKGDALPVESVSWTEAMEFCRKLTERERAADRLPAGYVYTLPTEAQWEYACRAGATADHAANTVEAAWHGTNSGETTHPVGKLPPNAWGFCDMQGNVWEWCSDWYGNKLKGGAVTDPKGNANGTLRVRRGGSYVIKPELMRFAMRGTGEPDARTYNIGFRVALVPGS